MRDHYDFSKGVQGKHTGRYEERANMVLLDPDIAKEFPDDAAVNKALRQYLRERKNSPNKPA